MFFRFTAIIYHCMTRQRTVVTLKITSAQVVEMSVNVNNNSSLQNYTNPDDNSQTTDTQFWIQTIYKTWLHHYVFLLSWSCI